jgi:hypothetical protein
MTGKVDRRPELLEPPDDPLREPRRRQRPREIEEDDWAGRLQARHEA